MANKKQITFGGARFVVVDLSEPLSLDVEVYPGDPKPRQYTFSDISKTGWQHHQYLLGDHNFHPHADAPKHNNPGMQDKGMEVFGLEQLLNKAILIDVSVSETSIKRHGISFTTKVTTEHLEPFRKYFSKVGAVIVRTGYDRWLEANHPHEIEAIPGITESAAKLLASYKNIRVVGIDSLSVGSSETHRAFKHMLIVESLVHLYDIPKSARTNFNIFTAPIRIRGATGGPVAAYAFIKK